MVLLYCQIILLVYKAVKTTLNDQVGYGVCRKGQLGCEFFYVCRRVLREWAVGGIGLYGYFGEQGLPVCAQECLEGFHLGFVLYRSKRFVSKLDSPNGEGEFATARTTSLLVELVGVAAGWMCKGGLHTGHAEALSLASD